jgi:hypothetical protein
MLNIPYLSPIPGSRGLIGIELSLRSLIAKIQPSAIQQKRVASQAR